MNKPQITTHYADGRPSETRDMTDEELSQLLPDPVVLIDSTNDSD
jgi:hypothetical protein